MAIIVSTPRCRELQHRTDASLECGRNIAKVAVWALAVTSRSLPVVFLAALQVLSWTNAKVHIVT